MLEATLILAFALFCLWLFAAISRPPRPCGYRICMDCHRILGRAVWLPEGHLTHGLCKRCSDARIAEEQSHE